MQNSNNWIQNLWKLRREQSQPKSLNLKYDLKTLSENDLQEVKNFKMENVMHEMQNTTYRGIGQHSTSQPNISTTGTPPDSSSSARADQRHMQLVARSQMGAPPPRPQQTIVAPSQIPPPASIPPNTPVTAHPATEHPMQHQQQFHSHHRMYPKLTKTTSANSYLLQNQMQQFHMQQQLHALQEEQKKMHMHHHHK
mmetsp:Transcript_830/g.2843  ORF Transcript_830/g.2843 Transcript_830/m.2843 type:complete len:196 (-) Transcript_830:110-697(-)